MIQSRLALRRRVLVNLKTGRALRGVLWSRSRGLLVLKDVEVLEAGRPAVAMIGEAIVDRENVDFVQVLPDVAVAELSTGTV